MRVRNLTPRISRTPAHLEQKHRIVVPPETHWRPATSAEASCKYYLEGWKTVVSSDSQQAYYIRKHSGRRFVEQMREGGLVEFEFESGQDCFQGPNHYHKLPIGLDPLFIKETVHGRRLMEVNQFTDDMNETAHRINKAQKEG